MGNAGLSRRSVREQRILVLPGSGMHDDASLLGLIAIPEIDHENEAVAVDRTAGKGQIIALHAAPTGASTHFGDTGFPALSKMRSWMMGGGDNGRRSCSRRQPRALVHSLDGRGSLLRHVRNPKIKTAV